MPLPGNKASTPFKTMDIKTALLSGGNRKRKTSPPLDEPKTKKISVEHNDHDTDIEILDEACGITVTLQPSELDSTLGDCKENKDINAAEIESSVTGSKENKLLSPTKDPTKEELSPNVNKAHSKHSNLESPKSPKEVVSENDLEMLSDKSKNSDNSSCDELNNSANVSLNTSGQSVSGDDEVDKGQSSSKVKDESGNKSGEKTPKGAVKERVKKRMMTPAEAKKKAEEREQKKKERLLKKQEMENRKKERLLEKERRQKEKMLRKEREEFERKERERIKQEKKEQEEKERLQKQKEKEEKAKIKQMQLEQKLEEKKKKEEMRLKKEEEEKRAKLEKEQKEKEKQERAKAAFAKFFVKTEAHTSAPPAQVAEKEGVFLPFQVTGGMVLAPVVPLAAQERFDKKQLDHYLEHQDGKELYLQILKCRSYKDVRQRKRNRKLEDSDVIVIDKNAQAELGLCPKLLQFSENLRPPYWGTWRKKSKNIRPRNPFAQDEIFDYSVDSDEEWDEGGPGESLSGTENEDESEDDYEVDNEFMVPHGYLSDEEEKKEDDDEEVNDPEKQKALLKLKLQEFEMERKKKTTELKPIILGCHFINDPAFLDSGLEMFLQTYCAEFLSETPIPTSFTIKNQQNDCSNNASESPKSSNSSNNQKKKVPEEAFPQLIRLVHGNTKNKKVLAEEFQKFWLEQYGENQEVKQDTSEPTSNMETNPSKENANDVPSDSGQISLRQLNQTIREIATYGKPPDAAFNKCCWWVHDNIREKYGLIDAPIPNQWKYTHQKEPEPPAKVNSTSIKEFLSCN